MYQPNEREKLLLDWAVSCGIYSPAFFAFDGTFQAVWLRVYRSLDVCVLGYERYWEILGWLAVAGQGLPD